MSMARPGKWWTRRLVVFGAVIIGLVAIALVASACAGPAGPVGASGSDGTDGRSGVNASESCSQCHDDSSLILSKRVQAAQQGHQTGSGWSYAGGRASCTGCHSHEGFTARIASGVAPGDVEEAPANPTFPNCRTCHEIHTSYTSADWALTTTAPVTVSTGDEYDQGNGNLCAACHLARRNMAEVGFADGADVTITSSHWGPHHGTEPEMLLGVGGYGVSDSASVHYSLVEDGCPTCHVAEGNHTMNASLAGCQSCHADLDTLDRNGVQTEVEELMAELSELLETAGLLHDGHPVADSTGTETEVGAAWNYLFVLEDGSNGVHNPSYTKALLNSAIAALE